MSAETTFFYLFSAGALLSGSAVVSMRSSVAIGAVGLLGTWLNLSGLFVLLGAPFLAVAQILIATGSAAVMLLFALLLSTEDRRGAWSDRNRMRALRVLGIGVVVAAAMTLIRDASRGVPAEVHGPVIGEAFGGVREMGQLLFTEFIVPVELIGLVLLSSIIGAGVLARRRLD